MKLHRLIYIAIFLFTPFALAQQGDFCAKEGQYCAFSGKALVSYGAKGRYITHTHTNGVECSNAIFGDPIRGVVKRCFYELIEPQGPSSSIYCSDEGGFCEFDGEAKVWYGANGLWNFRNAYNGIRCNNKKFGDAAPGMLKHCFYTPVQTRPEGPRSSTYCSDEGGYCRFDGKAKVWYGARGEWNTKVATDGIRCNNKRFGDPLPGASKKCFFKAIEEQRSQGPGLTRFCAREGEYCSFDGKATVWYGTDDLWNYRDARNGIRCNNKKFGDAAPGRAKKCYFQLHSQHFVDGPQNSRYCAEEGEFCSFDGPARVYYGLNGHWRDLDVRNGIACNNRNFGDPLPGVAKKCFVLPIESHPQWIKSYNGRIPANALAAGNDKASENETLYLCVAKHQGGFYPGKVSRSLGGCSIAWGKRDVTLKKYKVLVDGESFQWRRARKGRIPASAERVGREFGSQGKDLFSCRAYFNGGLHPGRIGENNHGCIIASGGRSHTLKKYEVLVNE